MNILSILKFIYIKDKNHLNYVEGKVLKLLFKYEMLDKSDFQILLQIHLEGGYISPRIIQIFNEYSISPLSLSSLPLEYQIKYKLSLF